MGTILLQTGHLELTCKHDISIFDPDPLHSQTYKFLFEILESNDPEIPIELLLFRKISNQAIELNKRIDHYDKFVTVCAISDIYTYPAAEPDCARKDNYFRKSKVEGALPSLDECYRVLNRMKELLHLTLKNVTKIRENTIAVPEYKITD